MGNLGPTGSKSEDDGPLELIHLFLLGHEQAMAESFLIFFTFSVLIWKRNLQNPVKWI